MGTAMDASFEHATEETLEFYALGILAEAEAEALEEHLLICADCQDRLAETDDYVRHMRAAAAKLRTEQRRRLTWSAGRLSIATVVPKLAGVTAALCGLLALTWVFASRTPSNPAGSPPFAVTLQTDRGEGDSIVSKAPRGQVLLLQADLTGLPSRGLCEVEIVDAEGRPAGQPRVKSEGDKLIAVVSGLRAGSYWVRLYASGSKTELLREYALRVQ
jgi:hypothetical protein